MTSTQVPILFRDHPRSQIYGTRSGTSRADSDNGSGYEIRK
jgi:hypothetical protein